MFSDFDMNCVHRTDNINITSKPPIDDDILIKRKTKAAVVKFGLN